jgi:hypothetical protein
VHCWIDRFLVTAALILVWSIKSTQDRTSLHSDGKKRCFWAMEDGDRSRQYHDRHHGVIPNDDHELFARVALELLTDGRPWKERGAYAQLFQGFAPDIVAKMSAAELDASQRLDLMKTFGEACVAKLESAINISRCLENYRTGQVNVALVYTLKLQAAEGSGAAVSFFRSALQLEPDFPAGSFLQSIGILPGAHFNGCWLDPERSAGNTSPS